ncbi:hypothetical protein [Bacillus thuringiensis]|uniref:hypothetical protein n=1 Tax=Bacillus thuringiensis TaxID=1428 RepID=UPI000BFBCE84|nr:hypothetical protein [Bacillus thuringiensis]PGH92598.1 hypothetical protein CN898_26455 [Bacillus thuringiensis]
MFERKLAKLKEKTAHLKQKFKKDAETCKNVICKFVNFSLVKVYFNSNLKTAILTLFTRPKSLFLFDMFLVYSSVF